MTLKEIIGEMDKAPIVVEKLRSDSLSLTEAVKLGIEYRKMLALENIGSLLAHIDATLTDLNETVKWKQDGCIEGYTYVRSQRVDR